MRHPQQYLGIICVSVLIAGLVAAVAGCSGDSTESGAPTAAESGAPTAAESERSEESAPTGSCTAEWQVVPSDALGSGVLYDLAAVSEKDIWAVGTDDSSGEGAGSTLVAHWDGASWKAVPSPNVAKDKTNVLYGVTAVSAKDVWAVGGSSRGALIEHWNGKRWKVVPTPGSPGQGLSSVAAVSASDVWAVGEADGRTLIQHWYGRRWQVVPSPDAGLKNPGLNRVTAVSSDDVWAVGFSDEGTLVEHWDGTEWKVVSGPSLDRSLSGYLLGVASLSATEVWAVGYTQGNQDEPLVGRACPG